jgi:hypothetical protein
MRTVEMKPGMVVHTCNPSIWVAEAGESGV